MTSRVMRMCTKVIQYVKYGLEGTGPKSGAGQRSLGKGTPQSPNTEGDTHLSGGVPAVGAPHRWLSVISSWDCTMLLRLRR